MKYVWPSNVAFYSLLLSLLHVYDADTRITTNLSNVLVYFLVLVRVHLVRVIGRNSSQKIPLVDRIQSVAMSLGRSLLAISPRNSPGNF